MVVNNPLHRTKALFPGGVVTYGGWTDYIPNETTNPSKTTSPFETHLRDDFNLIHGLVEFLGESRTKRVFVFRKTTKNK